MTDYTPLFSHMRLRHAIASTPAILLLVMLLAGCSNHDNLDPKATSLPRVDTCTLVTDAMVQQLAPGLGASHLMKPVAHQPDNITTCAWDDANHVPALMLTVAPADPSGVAGGLADGFANMGYHIVSVAGLGDEAAAAIQIADPKHGLTEAVAILAVRVGRQQLIFSPVMLSISKPGTPAFGRLKQLAADAIAHLGTSKQ